MSEKVSREEFELWLKREGICFDSDDRPVIYDEYQWLAARRIYDFLHGELKLPEEEAQPLNFAGELPEFPSIRKEQHKTEV